ncbi:MAG: hypothetical protein ACLUHE_01140 [Christensenellales bacterium]
MRILDGCFFVLAYGYRFFSAGFGGDAALVSLSGQAAYQASLAAFTAGLLA